jgi:hypothetical protein
MSKTFKFMSRWGTEYEIRFIKTAYTYDGSLAICVEGKEPDFGWWEPYANLTVNLGDGLTYLDANNVPDLCEFVIGKGWAKVVGEGFSGFCTYPRVEFTDEFIDEVCEEEE